MSLQLRRVHGKTYRSTSAKQGTVQGAVESRYASVSNRYAGGRAGTLVRDPKLIRLIVIMSACNEPTNIFPRGSIFPPIFGDYLQGHMPHWASMKNRSYDEGSDPRA